MSSSSSIKLIKRVLLTTKGIYFNIYLLFIKFQDPIPAPTWFSTFEAINNTIACPQTKLNNNFTFPMSPQENCLVANIYVPDTTQKKLPVVVYVHGGAYLVGSGTMMEAKNLVRSKKVIVVTFNYRLGLHGFLCLGTHDIPGNAGMKDQIALLRWVNKHIESYGGNPQDVTIAGQSAGSSAVDLLMLSPAAKGLFHKVIPESGASLAPWSIQIDPLENAKYIAKKAGFDNVDDIYALEEFYKTASFDLLKSTSEFLERTDANFLLSPCLERKGSEGPFLTDSPYKILKSGKYPKVPLLYGFADMEGLLHVPVFDTLREKMNANFSDFIPADLKFDSVEEREEVAKKIKKFYFGEKPVSQESILSFINFISDVYFGYSTLKAVQLFVESGHDRVYLYEYNFVDESEPAIPYTDNVRGATHCAQSFAILDGKNFESPDETMISEEYKKVKAVMRELWVNFITTG